MKCKVKFDETIGNLKLDEIKKEEGVYRCLACPEDRIINLGKILLYVFTESGEIELLDKAAFDNDDKFEKVDEVMHICFET